MFSIGTILKTDEFLEVVKRPKLVVIGLISQFTLITLIAYVLTIIFKLDPSITLGVILVGYCPRGTESNTITFLAKSDVTLSFVITSSSTVYKNDPTTTQGIYGAIDRYKFC